MEETSKTLAESQRITRQILEAKLYTRSEVMVKEEKKNKLWTDIMDEEDSSQEDFYTNTSEVLTDENLSDEFEEEEEEEEEERIERADNENVTNEVEKDEIDISKEAKEILLKNISRRYKFMRFEYVEGDYRNNLNLLSDLAVEIYIRNNRNYSYLMDLKRMDEKMTINGKEKTPDFIVRNVDGSIKEIFEFKTSLYSEREEIFEQRFSENMKSKYGEKTRVIFLIKNKEFLKNYSINDKKDRLTYLALLEKIKKGDVRNNPNFKLFENVMQENETTMEKAKEFFKKHDSDLEFRDYKSLKTCLKEVIAEIGTMEKFANRNYISVKDQIEELIMPSINMSNCFMPNPFNRKYNKKFMEKIDHPMVGRIPNKTNYLMHCPLFKGVQKMSSNKSEKEELLLNCFKDNTVVNRILDSLTLKSEESNETKVIRELTKQLAFIKSNIKGDEKSLKYVRRYNCRSSEGLQNKIIMEIKRQKKKIKKKLDVRYLSRRGKSVLPRRNEVVVNKFGITEGSFDVRKIRQDYKEKLKEKYGDENDKRDEAVFFQDEEIDWFKEVWNYYPSNKLGENYNVDFKDPYDNDVLNMYSFYLNKRSKGRVHNTLNNKVFNVVYRLNKFYRAISLSMNRDETKSVTNREIQSIDVPGEDFITFCSPAPNEITSGPYFTMFEVDKLERIPNHFPLWKYIKLGKNFLCLSKVVRSNQKVMDQHDSMVGSLFALLMYSQELQIKDIWENGLLGTFFLEYSRDLTGVLEVLYFFQKAIVSIGSFGKQELKDKINGNGFKDIRVSDMLFRLKKNFNKSLAEYQSVGDSNKDFGVLNFIDPVFGFTHKGIETVQFVSALKQLVPADDGYDDVAFKWKFLKKEIKYEQEYSRSKFHNSIFSMNESHNFKSILEKMLVNDTGLQWDPFSYWPDLNYRVYMLMIEEAKLKDPELKSKFPMQETLASTIKNSAVAVSEDSYGNLPINEKMVNKGFEDPSKLSRVWNTKLNEAMTLLSHQFLKDIREDVISMGNGEKIEGNFFNSTFKARLESYQPTLEDIVLYSMVREQESFPTFMNNKNQKTKEKRNFFNNKDGMRCMARFSDFFYRPILATIYGDVILEKGNEKFMSFERIQKIFNQWHADKFGTTEDRTKFGDKHNMQALELQHKCLYHAGIITKNLAELLSNIDYRIYNRVIIVPPEIRRDFEKLCKKQINEMTDSESKRHIYWQQVQTFLKYNGAYINWNKFKLGNQMQINLAIRRTCGFILGVMNIRGSLAAAGQVRTLKLLAEYLGIDKNIEGFTHSDDSQLMTELKMINEEIFKEEVLVEMRSKLGKFKKNNGKVIKNGRKVLVYTENKVIKKVKSDVASKYLVVLGLFIPKMFGQTPSLAKWSITRVNEMLQVWAFGNSVTVPLLRAVVPLGNKLSLKSYSIGLTSGLGLVYDTAVNGGGAQLINDMIWATNWIASFKFGIWDIVKFSINKMPQLYGFYYVCPPLIVANGFEGNNIRLINKSKNDPNIKRMLKIMLNDREVWDDRKLKKISEEEIVKKIMINDEESEEELNNNEANMFGLNINKQEESFAEKFVDFGINIMRRAKTNGLFFEKEIIYRKTIENDLKVTNMSDIRIEELKTMNWKDLIKELEKEWKIDFMAKNSNNTQDIVRSLSMYLKPQYIENNFRIPESRWRIAALGHYKRLYVNPFTQTIIQKFKLSDEMSVGEIVGFLDKNFMKLKPGNSGERAFKLMVNFYASALNLIETIDLDINVTKEYKRKRRNGLGEEIVCTINNQTTYQKVIKGYGLTKYNFDLEGMMSIVIETLVYGKRYEYCKFFKRRQWKIADSSFRVNVEDLKNILINSGYNKRNLLRSVDAIISILKTRGFRGVVKCVDGNRVISDFFGNLYSTYTKLKVKGYITQGIATNNVAGYFTTNVSLDIQNRLILTILNNSKLSDEYKKIKIYFGETEIIFKEVADVTRRGELISNRLIEYILMKSLLDIKTKRMDALIFYKFQSKYSRTIQKKKAFSCVGVNIEVRSCFGCNLYGDKLVLFKEAGTGEVGVVTNTDDTYIIELLTRMCYYFGPLKLRDEPIIIGNKIKSKFLKKKFILYEKLYKDKNGDQNVFHNIRATENLMNLLTRSKFKNNRLVIKDEKRIKKLNGYFITKNYTISLWKLITGSTESKFVINSKIIAEDMKKTKKQVEWDRYLTNDNGFFGKMIRKKSKVIRLNDMVYSAVRIKEYFKLAKITYKTFKGFFEDDYELYYNDLSSDWNKIHMIRKMEVLLGYSLTYVFYFVLLKITNEDLLLIRNNLSKKDNKSESVVNIPVNIIKSKLLMLLSEWTTVKDCSIERCGINLIKEIIYQQGELKKRGRFKGFLGWAGMMNISINDYTLGDIEYWFYQTCVHADVNELNLESYYKNYMSKDKKSLVLNLIGSDSDEEEEEGDYVKELYLQTILRNYDLVFKSSANFSTDWIRWNSDENIDFLEDDYSKITLYRRGVIEEGLYATILHNIGQIKFIISSNFRFENNKKSKF